MKGGQAPKASLGFSKVCHGPTFRLPPCCWSMRSTQLTTDGILGGRVVGVFCGWGGAPQTVLSLIFVFPARPLVVAGVQDGQLFVFVF